MSNPVETAFFAVLAAFAGPIIVMTVWEFRSAFRPHTTQTAHIVGRRTATGGYQLVTTAYYVTLQFPTGDRREYAVGGPFFGLLAEGDVGQAVLQGDRLRDFRRGAPDLQPLASAAMRP